MNVPSDPPRFYRLHHCKAHGHYHIISGPEDVSWPLWSREAILNMARLCRAGNHLWLQPEDIPRAERELGAIRDEANRLARTQRRDRGKFTKDFLIPRNMLPGERGVTDGWSKFRCGAVPYMGYVAEEVFGTLFLPLYCDFVGRDEPLVAGRSLSRAEWARLAEKPARVVTIAELGLALGLAA